MPEFRQRLIHRRVEIQKSLYKNTFLVSIKFLSVHFVTFHFPQFTLTPFTESSLLTLQSGNIRTHHYPQVNHQWWKKKKLISMRLTFQQICNLPRAIGSQSCGRVPWFQVPNYRPFLPAVFASFIIAQTHTHMYVFKRQTKKDRQRISSIHWFIPHKTTTVGLDWTQESGPASRYPAGVAGIQALGPPSSASQNIISRKLDW